MNERENEIAAERQNDEGEDPNKTKHQSTQHSILMPN